jgi:hypothetical protein
VVARNNNRRDVFADSLEKPSHRAFRFRWRRRALEHIACHQHEVDFLALNEVAKVFEDVLQFWKPVLPLPDAAGVPITGVQNAH